MKKNIAVLLSGCGVFDGAEIYESVITLLELDKAGATAICMAPDIPQLKVVNHLTNSQMDEKRNVLVEAARLARGKILNIKNVNVNDYDALILPGGFGAALNNCNFAIEGANGKVDPQVAKLVNSFFTAGKPIGAMCIAPALLALALKGEAVKLTIGSDQGVAGIIQTLGHQHINCQSSEIAVDEKFKIVTTPAYMTATSISEAAAGITKLVKKVIELA